MLNGVLDKNYGLRKPINNNVSTIDIITSIEDYNDASNELDTLNKNYDKSSISLEQLIAITDNEKRLMDSPTMVTHADLMASNMSFRAISTLNGISSELPRISIESDIDINEALVISHEGKLLVIKGLVLGLKAIVKNLGPVVNKFMINAGGYITRKIVGKAMATSARYNKLATRIVKKDIAVGKVLRKIPFVPNMSKTGTNLLYITIGSFVVQNYVMDQVIKLVRKAMDLDKDFSVMCNDLVKVHKSILNMSTYDQNTVDKAYEKLLNIFDGMASNSPVVKDLSNAAGAATKADKVFGFNIIEDKIRAVLVTKTATALKFSVESLAVESRPIKGKLTDPSKASKLVNKLNKDLSVTAKTIDNLSVSVKSAIKSLDTTTDGDDKKADALKVTSRALEIYIQNIIPGVTKFIKNVNETYLDVVNEEITTVEKSLSKIK